MGVHDGRARLDRATRMTLPMPEGADDVVLTFPVTPQHFGRYLGVVTDQETGAPVAGHPVALVDAEGGRKLQRFVQTARDGTFQFPFLPPGDYVCAFLGTRRHLHGQPPPFRIEAAKKIEAKVGLHRRPPGPLHAIRVRVQGRLGLPVPGATVAPQAENYAAPVADCGPDGVALIDDLPVRPMAVLASAPGHWPEGVAVPPGEPGEVAEVHVTLDEQALLRVSARDASTGKPLRYANFLVSGTGADQWHWGGVPPPPDQPPREHVAFAVRPGTLTVRADSPGYFTATVSVEAAAGAEPPPVVFRLEARRR
jgi:hypothetical protein